MLRKSHSSSCIGSKSTQGLLRRISSPPSQFLSTTGSPGTWASGRRGRAPSSPGSMGASSRLMGAPGVDPDYVMQLVNDVRWFADVLLNLKDAFQHTGNLAGLQELVQERLAELFRALKTVIGKHQTLNSVDILGAAGTVIAKVKGVDFKDVNSENRKAKFRDIHTSIDTLAFTFGNVVSDFLMGDVDSGSGLGIPQTKRSRSFDNLTVDPDGDVPERNELAGTEGPLSREEEVDLTLLKNDSGVESALLYAKAWSKYIKELLAWMEKRVAMDIEYAKNYAKMAESAKALASQQDFMPFHDIYVSTFKNEIDNNHLLLQTALALQTNKFMQPLLTRKNELDKLRKEIKEQWQRELKKMLEADAALRKAQTLTDQRREEYKKAHSSTNRSQEEQPNTGNKQLEKKRRLEEEALQKAEEAQDQYHSCRADAGVRRMDLANAKRTILTQIREMIFQCDLTLKAVTVNWFQLQQAQTLAVPTQNQALSENAKLYEPGECYAEFVRNLPKHLPKEHLQSISVSFDTSRFGFNRRFLGSLHSSQGNLSQASTTSCDDSDNLQQWHAKIGDQRSNSSTDLRASRNQGSQKAWAASSQATQGGMCSDSESAGGSSESRSMDSPTASPGDFKRRLPRTPSTGTMSSADDLDDRPPPSPSDNGPAELSTDVANSPGPFRNALMSKAAQTHKLRKIRAPSKCRECDSLVVFHGAECEECSLACHKKCLETLAIQCGHKKLQGRLQLFGIDFAVAAKNSPDGIPFIIKKCTSEIESRALNIEGIYRVNAAKSRVEKLCQAFENGKDLVELSEHSPHDISNVLKLYLRQLPEALILNRFYNDFIGLAKECQKASKEAAEKNQTNQQVEKSRPGAHLNRVIFRVRNLVRQLPAANFKTLRFLIAHLNKVTEHAEENKMTASNLGIIFGPTLVKPQQTDAEVSLSSLVDYPYQVLMVELLVQHFRLIFDVSSPGAAEVTSRGSPRLTPQEKIQQLSRHSTSLIDIKEIAKEYKRYSSAITSSQTLNEVREAEPDQGKSSTSDKLNGLQPIPAEDPQKSNSEVGQPNSTISPSTSAAPNVLLRTQRARQAYRPISMPLERLTGSAQVGDRNSRNAVCQVDGRAERDAVTETIEEVPEQEKARQSGSSRISTYYITPFIDTQTMPRRTWDRKYKHYDVTPRTAMIVANLPTASSGPQPLRATVPVSVVSSTSSGTSVHSNNNHSVTVRPFLTSKRERDSERTDYEAVSSSNFPLTLRAPRTLQPPPGTFYKPPESSTSRTRTLLSRTISLSSPPTSPLVVSTSPPPSLTSSKPARLEYNDSTDSAIDPGAPASSSSSPQQSPLPGSPDDLSPGEPRPIYQRLRSRCSQDFEQREAHFV